MRSRPSGDCGLILTAGAYATISPKIPEQQVLSNTLSLQSARKWDAAKSSAERITRNELFKVGQRAAYAFRELVFRDNQADDCVAGLCKIVKMPGMHVYAVFCQERNRKIFIRLHGWNAQNHGPAAFAR